MNTADLKPDLTEDDKTLIRATMTFFDEAEEIVDKYVATIEPLQTRLDLEDIPSLVLSLKEEFNSARKMFDALGPID